MSLLRFFEGVTAGDELERVVEYLTSEQEGLLSQVAWLMAEQRSGLGELERLAIAVDLAEACRLALGLGPLNDSRKQHRHWPAVVVAGLPRTGTTYLQNLLASAGLMTPLGWQVSTSALLDLADGGCVDENRAVEETNGRYGALRSFCPSLHEMHPLGAHLVEECTPIFRSTGQHFPWAFMAHIPALTQLLTDDFGTDGHRHWQNAIELLGPGVATVVKSPIHTGYLSSLFRSDLSIRVVVVRRDIQAVAASVGTMIYSIRSGLSGTASVADAGVTARSVLESLALAARQSFDETDATRLLVLGFEDVVRSPCSAVRDVGNFLGLTLGTPRSSVGPDSGEYRILAANDLGISQDWCEMMRELAPELAQ